MNKQHIAVLMGGLSSERLVSLVSGQSCADALVREGYDVTCVDVDHNIAEVLSNLKPDIAFNALHGTYGEDGTIQAILEYLKIPYTHSGVLASALAMDKKRAGIVAASAGVVLASSKVMKRDLIKDEHPMPPPYVMKPLKEGSSFGVIVILEESQLPGPMLAVSDWRYGDDVLVEHYVAGRELTCVVMGDRALDVCEIITAETAAFFNFELKYNSTDTIHVCPAKISSNIYENIQRMSLEAHQALGCRGVTRSDFRYNEKEDILVWLEINTQPGMTPTSLTPDIARVSGYEFDHLVRWMAEDASCLR